MPQLDFREALSTPDEQTMPAFAARAATAAMFLPPPEMPTPFRALVRLSRSAWTNVVFVAIAAIGGLVSGFYFFNGTELVSAAASWPAEFLYPRPISIIDRPESVVQPNPVDQFSSELSATKNAAATASSNRDLSTANLSLADTSFDVTNSPPTAIPFPPPPPPPPAPPSLLDQITMDVNGVVSGTAPLVQSVETTVNQTLTSIAPKQPIMTTTRKTVSSTRRKLSSARTKISAQVTTTSSSSTSSATQTMQQNVTQTQMGMNSGLQAPTQTMMGTGIGGVGGIGGAGAIGGSGLGGGIGGAAGGLGNVGGSLGGLGGLGGHH